MTLSSFFLRPLLAALCLPLVFGAAQAKDDDWDVQKPPVKTTSVAIDVEEGTWISLDVSPDDQTIVFDLLGDIYTLPISGGRAKSIASGMAWEIQPRFSPDGERIAFLSDRSGGDNVWLMDADGANKRALTQETFRQLSSPSWHPDGSFIAARKHFTTTRSAGTGEVWMYSVAAGQSGLQLIERPSEAHQKDLGEPVFSPDGRYVYFSRNTTPGAVFEYAQDSNKALFAIERYDLETGERETIVSGQGGAVRPTPSPDGTLLAFVRRERAKSKLYLKDLRSGKTRKIYDALDQDMQETWSVQGLYPNMAWLSDSQTLLFWAGGKIRRLDVATGETRVIPFQVKAKKRIAKPPRPQVDVAPDAFKTTLPRFAASTASAETVYFESLGQIYQVTGDGAPTVLIPRRDGVQALFPDLSRDGTSLVYVRWSDDKAGMLVRRDLQSGEEVVLVDEPGHYRRPRFSPDGRRVVYEKGVGSAILGPDWSQAPGLYVVAENGAPKRLLKKGRFPHFGGSGERIFASQPNAKSGADLVSMDLNGRDLRTHATGELITQYQVSPDGKTMLFAENYQAYLSLLPPGDQKMAAGIAQKSFPAIKVSGDGATFMRWADAQTISWTLGPDFFTAKRDAVFSNAGVKDEKERPYQAPSPRRDLSVDVQADVPAGIKAFVGARIITMADEAGGVIEQGTVLVENNRIVAVGSMDAVDFPEGAQVFDVAGRTIIPGLIDAHAHSPYGEDMIVPEQNWSVMAHLALGVTTMFDPSTFAATAVPASEQQRAGLTLAPRLFSTGEVVYGAKLANRYAQIESYADARAHVRRLKAQGAHAIKNYNQPRRNQRQMVTAAAMEEGIAVVGEGGSHYQMDMSMLVDGNTGIEHNLPPSTLYEDVLSLFAQSNVANTPTLIVTYGGLRSLDYWRMALDVWEHPLLKAHVPAAILHPATVRRTKAPESDFAEIVRGTGAKALRDRGVYVSAGGHGEQQGLALHFEMWSFGRSGFSPLEALQAATIVPARHLGFDKDLGSIEAGKLADLVVLEGNPLEDIRASDSVSQIVLNGRVYDPHTLDEEGGRKTKPYYWERPGFNAIPARFADVQQDLRHLPCSLHAHRRVPDIFQKYQRARANAAQAPRDPAR